MEIRLNKINLSEKTLKVTKYSIWKELSYKYLNNSNNLQRPFTYSVLFELVNSSIKEGDTGRLLSLSYTFLLMVSYTLIAQYITSVGNGKCLSNK